MERNALYNLAPPPLPHSCFSKNAHKYVNKGDFVIFFKQAYQTAFERNLQKKDDLIDALNDLMSQNDEEYDNAFDMHIHNLDNILGKKL